MDGMEWMGSAMRAARAELDVATHDLANAASDGFRKTIADVRLTPHGLAVTTRVSPEQGAMRATGRQFDLALLGPGVFRVGDRTTREGAFSRDRDGWLVDDRGQRLHGACGALRVSPDARVDADGLVHDRGRVVDRLPLPPGTHVQAGALESSAVNAVDETLAILTAQRAFETAQKTLLALDATREKAANEIGRVQ
ncbi:MAG TPA: flagellar basal body rod C-terminal domain-containing protein [Candidatus Sulfotelmatobacter sp.]|nr:flagellar basal body rod C-terminal domain-containing protein [Candidatus Sulfotelmatobacter sp.]